MTKKNHDEPKEMSKSLSEWQKRNKEYLEKKAQEQTEKEEIESEVSDELSETAEQELANEENSVGDVEETEEFQLTEDDTAILSAKQLKKLTKSQKKSQKHQEKPALSGRHLLRSLPVLIGSSFVFLLSVYFLTPLSTMKQINISGNQMVSQEELLKGSKIDNRDYTLTTFINTPNYIRNMQSVSPWIENVEMSYQFPVTFNVHVKEYTVVAYMQMDGQYYPVLSNGDVIKQAISSEKLPEKFITIELTDHSLIKKFAQQIEKVPDEIRSNIRTVQLTPSKVTPDLLTLTMRDENKILVPTSHIAKKLPYYKGIQPQLEEPSVVDMEAGIFSYVQGTENEETEDSSTDHSATESEERVENGVHDDESIQPTEGEEDPQKLPENTENIENR